MTNIDYKVIRKAAQLAIELEQLLAQANEITDSTDRTQLDEEERVDLGLLYQLQNEAHTLHNTLDYHFNNTRGWVSGRLVRMPNGRYCIDGDPSTELYSGSMIQYRDGDFDDDEALYWTSRIESHAGEYYIVAKGKGKPIDNVIVRKHR